MANASIPKVSTNIRSEYLQGHPIALQITFRNQTDKTVEIPNIELESWRVEFQITDSNGQTQTRSTRPDVYPKPTKWIIDQRQSRSLWLVLPAGQGLKSDQYTVSFSIDLEEEKYQSPDYKIKIQRPNPVSTYLNLVQHPLSHQNNPSLWTHKGTDGFSTYLHIGHTNNHSQTLFHDFVLKTKDHYHPKLSITQNGTRHLLWQPTPKQINYLTLQNNVPRHQVQQLAVPWPHAEIMGSPITAPDGTPQFLLWIQSPSTGGELRWCTVLSNGIPVYRKLTQLDEKPKQLSISMNDRGEALIALMEHKDLVLYTAIEANERPNIPVKGKKLNQIDFPVIDLQFSVHPEKGQVLQLLTHQNTSEWSQVTFTLNGEQMADIQIGKGALQRESVSFSAHHSQPAVAVEGKELILYINGMAKTIERPGFEWSLDRDQSGSLWIIGSGYSRPAIGQRIILEEP